MRVKFLFPILIFFVYSCNNKESNKKEDTESVKINLEYAKGFSIGKFNDFKILTISNPWQGAENVNYKYIIAKEYQEIPAQFSEYNIIRTPIRKVVCLSTTHIAFIDILNESQSIVAVSGTKYVNNEQVRVRIEKNEVLDIGYENSLNYELIVSLEPDLVLTYGIGGKVASYNQKLNDLGIQTMVIAEYLENEPLGKLEWLKLVATLYEKDELAEEYFNKTAFEYNDLTELPKQVSHKPIVLFGLPWKDVWYVPGGESYLAKMVDDAGGNYLWKENDSRESIPSDIESIFANAINTDIWLNTGSVNKKDEILKIDKRFTSFKPFNNANIYNNNLLNNKFGGNNYWESGLVKPQLVLKDLIKIFHPELLPEHKLVYYKIIE